MLRDKLLHCKKNVKHRGLYRAAPILVAAILAGCSWVEGDEPPPAEGDGEFPNLASVPERPDPSVFEEASLLEAGLRADRENARYDETPLAPSTAAGVAPPPPAPVAPAAPIASGAPLVTTTASPTVAVPADVAALPAEALPPAAAAPADATMPPAVATPPVVTAAPVVTAPPAGVPTVSVAPAPETVGAYSVDTPIASDPASLPPAASPVQVTTRPTPVVPEPAALAAVPPSPYQATQPSPYQAAPGQYAPGQAAPGQPPAGAQVAAINPMALSRNLVAGSTLPASVVYFADGSSRVSSAETAKIHQVAQFLASRGGYVRVIGHSSMRTGNMDRARQYQANLEVSWARANAVADALMRYGVPATAMMVSAVSDSRPIYMENMPSGEAGNRRVEIYLE